MRYAPVLKNISSGMQIILIVLIVAGAAAWLFQGRKRTMKGNIYLYILVMAAVTYAIRALPLTLIRKKISSRYIQSFLYYVPFCNPCSNDLSSDPCMQQGMESLQFVDLQPQFFWLTREKGFCPWRQGPVRRRFWCSFGVNREVFLREKQ